MNTESSIDQLKSFLREMFQFNTNDLDFGIYKIFNLKRKEIEHFIDEKDEHCLESIINQTLENVKNVERKAELTSLHTYLSKLNQQILLTNVEENFDQIKLFIQANKDEKERDALQKALNNSVKEFDITDEIKDQIYNHILGFFEMYYSNGDFGYNNRSRNLYKIPYESDYDGNDTLFHWKHKGSLYIKTGASFNAIKFNLKHIDKEFELRLETNEKSKDEETARNSNKDTKLKHYKFNRFEETEGITRIIFNLSDASTSKIELYKELFKAVFKSEEKLDKYLSAKNDKGELKSTFNDLTDGYDKVQDGSMKGIGALRVTRKILLNKVNRNFERASKIKLEDEGKPTEHFSDQTLETLYNIDQKLNSFYIGNDSDYFVHENLQEFLLQEKDRYIKSYILSDLKNILDGNLDNTTIIIAKSFDMVCSRIVEFLSAIEEFQKKLFTMKKKVVESEYCLTIDNLDEKYYPEIIANSNQKDEWETLFGIKVQKIADLKTKPTLVIDTKHFKQKDGSNPFKDKILAEIENLNDKISGILINSENYQALYFLQERFKGSFKGIYIDPPYNTGGDEGFLYKDNFKHSSWLTLMENRLILAKSLLQSDGTFAISIDINELHSTIKLMNSHFGSANEKAIATVRRSSVSGAKVINPGIVNISEYFLIYSHTPNNWDHNKIFREKKRDVRYNSFIKNRELDYTKWEYTTILEAFAEYKGISKSKLKKTLGANYDKELETFIFTHSNAIYQPASLDDDSISDAAVKIKYESAKNPNKTFRLEREGNSDYYLYNGKVLLFFEDRLIDVGGNKVFGELVADIWDDVLPNDIHNEGGVKLRKGKKPEKLIYRFVELATNKDKKEWILDYFGGSGTTGGVALKSGRKFVVIEMGKYFNTLTLPRLKNALFGEQSGISKIVNWKGSGFIQYIVLEQYEDLLDAIRQFEGEMPKNIPLRYLYRPELNKIDNTLDLSEPFSNKIQYGQPIQEGYVDLVETYNFFQGYEVKSVKAYIIGEKYYKVVETGDTLVIWRDIALGEDDSKAVNEIIEKYPEATRIEVNHDFNILVTQKNKQLQVGKRTLGLSIIHSDIFNQ
jgi:adenine-specific DNA-methyltransferase